MIPEPILLPGCLWRILPEGIHVATIAEVAQRFAVNTHRVILLQGLSRGIESLQQAGCKRLLLNGSFVTEKPLPNDYDACWEPEGVDFDKLDPVFLDFSNHRRAQKQKFLGEYFPSSSPADNKGTVFSEFFQIEKFTGKKKGIVQIDLIPLDQGGAL